ncbi:MAG: hypothetical protein U0694_04375 [Anaerolineae bacterium]
MMGCGGLMTLLMTLVGWLLFGITSTPESAPPVNPPLSGFDSTCEDPGAPCWYGIMLNVDPMMEADAALVELGYRFVEETQDADGFYRRYEGMGCELRLYFWEGVADHITVQNCRDPLTLADVIAALGEPVFLHLSADEHGTLVYQDIGLGVEFEQGLSADTPVTRLTIGRYIDGVDSFEWHGYQPFARYCEYQRDNYVCSGG